MRLGVVSGCTCSFITPPGCLTRTDDSKALLPAINAGLGNLEDSGVLSAAPLEERRAQ